MAQTRTEKIVIDGLKARQTKERNFKFFGIFAVALAIAFLAILLISICSKGLPGFFQYYATFEVELTRERIDPRGDMSDQSLFEGEAKKIINEAVLEFTGAKKRNEKKAARSLLSNGSDLRLVNFVQKNTDKLNSIQKIKFALDDDADSFFRGYIKKETPEKQRRLNDIEINYLEKMNEAGIVTYEISDYLFFGSASRNAEMAGIKGAFIGSMLTLAVCFLIAFPLGVATAVYLEEFAPKNKFTELIEININNLAAVPSVVFGILGLAIFINLFGMPRSIPLIGGLVLALMTLPTIIISSRAAIKAVPPSIRDGALAIGASKMQATMHHVVPLAIPGMLTGTIIGMAQALGETAPLLMIGMVAFIVDIPGSITDPGTVLPVQIFMWADFAERMFVHKTSAAIMILLLFLMIMNGGAVWLRRKLERRW
ncbi:MAG: phosphate transport system permease protein PstA [Alphaproteobacteria bacterium]|nr:MAG: phosphate transport system permease protein PstA [Alphaproteobacteria bacterium]